MSKYFSGDFPKLSLFCKKCFLHDTFWSGGNTWGIDHCPICGSEETVHYENMTAAQKQIAAKLFDEWWEKERINIVKEN